MKPEEVLEVIDQLSLDDIEDEIEGLQNKIDTLKAVKKLVVQRQDVDPKPKAKAKARINDSGHYDVRTTRKLIRNYLREHHGAQEEILVRELGIPQFEVERALACDEFSQNSNGVWKFAK